MASTEQDIAVGIDEIFKNATQSIADAEAFLNKAKPGIEKAKASKEGRSKLVSKASEVVNALLEPASRVADLLKFVGNFYQPCSAAGNVLQGIVDIETGRRDSDIRVGIIYLEFSTTLIQLGCLKPGFQHVRSLQGPLEDLLSGVKSLMEEFGQFCESFYEGKGLKNKLKHYMHFKPNAEKLTDFSTRLASLKTNLNLLLTHQGVLIASANATTLRGIEEKIDKLSHFFAELKDEPEAVAEDFIARNGGEDNVLENDALIDQLAKKLNLQLTSSILRAVKEGADESFRQSYERFHLKLTFAIENRIEVSTETIMKELRNGPYELIKDTDMKAVWKGIAPKESNLKRRQFIDAIVYQFNMTWKQYKVDCKVDREDFWTRSILTKVHYQLAIGDAIDDDASGYISIEEVNEFMQQKPSSWSTPKWVAYWAYGWDADNLEYRDRINKSYNKIQNLSQKDGLKKEKIKEYLDETQANIKKIANSLWSLDDLDAGADTQMKKLQDERRTQIENTMKTRLKTVNFRIEYDSMAAVCGSDRIEATLLPLVSVLLSRHIYLMSQATVKDEDIEEAIYTMNNIVGVVFNRISDLRRIWRRQRQDVDVQIRYYVNGLFQDYYKEHYKEFDSDEEEEYSDWDSEDEWGSEDDKQNPSEQHDEPDRRVEESIGATQTRSISQSQGPQYRGSADLRQPYGTTAQTQRAQPKPRSFKPSYHEEEEEEEEEDARDRYNSLGNAGDVEDNEREDEREDERENDEDEQGSEQGEEHQEEYPVNDDEGEAQDENPGYGEDEDDEY